MVLSPGQKTALSNLIGKQAGHEVGWINIADALSLTALGLAERGREGWTVTPAGAALGSGLDATTATPPSTLIAFP